MPAGILYKVDMNDYMDYDLPNNFDYLIKKANYAIYAYKECINVNPEMSVLKWNEATYECNNLENTIVNWLMKYSKCKYSITSLMQKYKKILEWSSPIQIKLINACSLKNTLISDYKELNSRM